MGVAAEICDALAARGITHTFAIQELTLPIALSGTDLIGQARTGMGKTYGFGVPLLDRVFDAADVPELDGSPRGLVVVPTRELAVQVANDLAIAAAQIPVRVATILGGRDFDEQRATLRAGVDVVVGTDRKSTRLNSSHVAISYAVFCLKKKKTIKKQLTAK